MTRYAVTCRLSTSNADKSRQHTGTAPDSRTGFTLLFPVWKPRAVPYRTDKPPPR